MRDRLIFATQVVDPDDPVLGATVAKLRALAARLDELVVLADRAVDGVLPPNCRVHVFGSASRGERAGRFVTSLNRELAPKPIAVVAHMVPRYAILAAPLTAPRRVPLLLWFTHWKTSRTLVLAERLSSAVLSVDRRSFPLPSGKVAAIGHGIDTAAFACVRRDSVEPLRVVSLGRTSPAKGYETIARAAGIAGVQLEVRGTSFTAEERGERDRLRALGVTLGEPVPYSEVPGLLAQKDVFVNNMREGALDKVVYEAAATCMPVLASNTGFDDILGPELRFDRHDPAELAEKLRALAGVDRNAVGCELRERVTERHSVEHWADRLLEVAEISRAGRSGGSEASSRGDRA
jgi:glycosyltransferase involved in cell wall biosynthesis